MTILDDPKYSFRLTEQYKTWTANRELVFAKQLSALRGRPVRCLEIGSFEGASSVWMLNEVLTHPDSRLHCVDVQDDTRMKVLKDNLAQTEREHLVTIHRLDSIHLRKHFEDESFDFVYVDAAHDAPSVLADVMSAYMLCKPGGLVGCDDYRLPRLINGSRPIEAIDAFKSIYAEMIEVTVSSYQLWFRKLG